MTEAETRYALIEIVLLRILFVCEKFHVVIEHNPLVALFNNPLNDCTLKIQRIIKSYKSMF